MGDMTKAELIKTLAVAQKHITEERARANMYKYDYANLLADHENQTKELKRVKQELAQAKEAWAEAHRDGEYLSKEIQAVKALVALL
jgi:flagellin-specific chaperone FliS